MEPAIWRKREGLSLRDVMRLVGCSSASLVQRWERGDSDPPNSMVATFKDVSLGAVTSDDFWKVRKRYLASQKAATTEAA